MHVQGTVTTTKQIKELSYVSYITEKHPQPSRDAARPTQHLLERKREEKRHHRPCNSIGIDQASAPTRRKSKLELLLLSPLPIPIHLLFLTRHLLRNHIREIFSTTRTRYTSRTPRMLIIPFPQFIF